MPRARSAGAPPGQQRALELPRAEQEGHGGDGNDRAAITIDGGGVTGSILAIPGNGITVNAVAPGEIATPMTGNDDVDPDTVDRPYIPLGRPGSAAEMAAVIAFLASPEASYVTGSSIVADGGLLLMAAIPNQRTPEG